MTIDIDRVVRGYLRCALFTGYGEDDTPYDSIYNIDDFEDESFALAYRDCATFVADHSPDLEKYLTFNDAVVARTDDDIGIDLWFTRNGHGAGFWDRGMGELGERLTEACRTLLERFALDPEENEFEHGSYLVLE